MKNIYIAPILFSAKRLALNSLATLNLCHNTSVFQGCGSLVHRLQLTLYHQIAVESQEIPLYL